jgi:hypothetical protein
MLAGRLGIAAGKTGPTCCGNMQPPARHTLTKAHKAPLHLFPAAATATGLDASLRSARRRLPITHAPTLLVYDRDVYEWVNISAGAGQQSAASTTDGNATPSHGWASTAVAFVD